MPYIYSEMQNKLSKTRESPLESMGQIVSSRCREGLSLYKYLDPSWLSAPAHGLYTWGRPR